jgi:hypothetical protein
MTATPDVFGGPVEGLTHELHVDPDGCGSMRWQLMRYQRHEGEMAWVQVATHTTATPPNGHYRDSARGWLLSLGYDPDAMDLILILPDGVERLGPGATV